MSDKQDETVSRTLAAIARTHVPHGLEARVLTGLQQHESTAQLKAERVAGLAAAWWRGALSGAAGALVLAAAIAIVAQHRTQRTTGDTPVATREGDASTRSSTVLAASVSDRKPCVPSAVLGTRKIAAEHGGETFRIDREAGPRPAPELGLTAQERELIRAARTADLKDLSALNPEARAKAYADDVAQFESFFYQPPIKSATEPNNE